MKRPIAVVVGAGGAIGRAFVARLLDDPRYAAVVAVGRRRPLDWPPSCGSVFLTADLMDETELEGLARSITELGEPGLILVATGMLHEDGLRPEKSIRALTRASLMRLFEVNAVLPALVAKHLSPLLQRNQPAICAAVSARVGSIGDNALGGWHAYRASKTALNMLIRGVAIELRRERPRAICVALHPGTVVSPLSAPFLGSNHAALSPDESARRMLLVLDDLDLADTGGFFAYDGTRLPW